MNSWKYMAAASVLAWLAGCGGNDNSLSQRTGSAVGGAATDFISGLGEGVDQKMKVELEFEPSIAATGLTVTLGKGRTIGTNMASVYVVSERPFKGTLLAKALDADGNEIGRAQTPFELAQDDATYVDLQFHQQMDSNLVRKYRISVR